MLRDFGRGKNRVKPGLATFFRQGRGEKKKKKKTDVLLAALGVGVQCVSERFFWSLSLFSVSCPRCNGVIRKRPPFESCP